MPTAVKIHPEKIFILPSWFFFTQGSEISKSNQSGIDEDDAVEKSRTTVSDCCTRFQAPLFTSCFGFPSCNNSGSRHEDMARRSIVVQA